MCLQLGSKERKKLTSFISVVQLLLQEFLKTRSSLNRAREKMHLEEKKNFIYTNSKTNSVATKNKSSRKFNEKCEPLHFVEICIK